MTFGDPGVLTEKESVPGVKEGVKEGVMEGVSWIQTG